MQYTLCIAYFTRSPCFSRFITALEEAKATDAQFVEEWGVEATTLEEVFLKPAAV